MGLLFGMLALYTPRVFKNGVMHSMDSSFPSVSGYAVQLACFFYRRIAVTKNLSWIGGYLLSIRQGG